MLHWKISARGGSGTHVMLYGEINEATSFGELKLLKGRVVMDFAGVKRINSFGVRELINFLEALRQAAQVDAERCSPALVNQLNMLPELVRKVTVRSIVAPVECAKCFHEHEIVVQLPLGALPTSRCEDCGGTMQLSEPPERYFAFMSEA
jgi:predicted nucleic acid-binding Zn ribbon protein